MYICIFPAAQEEVIGSSRYIKFSGVVLNISWTSARLGPSIKLKHKAMWNKGKAIKSTKMTRKAGETEWDKASGK